ncbi:glucose-6-phosphate isomerase [Staphylococcus warneri SG1]|nr:glucose-6-phosphate isomerase [Staphylococcus warneri SG1]KEK50781.1 glucose-6-phosphate isomerase domain protein [Staphylococcus warneri Lyso 1 2011]KEK58774.1 glucose-6-phosphate isomerase domain protein [Staphylococcus warneri Lyso 2 2011]
MTHIQLDYDKTKDIVKTIHHTIHQEKGARNDFLGWLDLPVD